MRPLLRRLRRHLEHCPVAGHPVVETLLERSARKNAFRGGYLLGSLLGALAPHVSLEPLARSFEEGLAAAEEDAPRGRGRVVPFPGR